MDKNTVKEKVRAAIAARAEEIIAIGEDIFHHPELGYKEERTAAVVEKHFAALGLPYRSGLALTGVKAYLEGSAPGPTVAILGELDAVVCPAHPAADPKTGAAHACGHNAQVAAMLGVAMGLVDAGVMEHLAGRVAFIAVPAEEFVELEYRQRLREEGKIRFFGGKQELIACGELDDIDLALMVHSTPEVPERKVFINEGSNGFLGKTVRYVGREAHAGWAPHEGVNALNAALLGLMGIHAQRETFRDQDHIRVHPIITKGGDLVNIVPSDVRLELYVRGRNIEAIADANTKVNRALKAGALAVGAEVEIEEIPGYLPLINDPALAELFTANMAGLIGAENITWGGFMYGSTDMGDITQLLPGLHPSIGGFSGKAHARDFTVSDPTMAYVIPAQAMAMTVVDLLWDGAEKARQIKEAYQAPLTTTGYLQLWNQFMGEK